MMNRTRHSWFQVLVVSGLIVTGSTAPAGDNGFEVGNAQGFFSFGGVNFLPHWNGLYGKQNDKPAAASKSKLRMKTYKDVRYDAFRELRRVLEPKGWESIRADGLDAMEREGFGHGEGRCNFEIRFLNSASALVTADYEAVPDCTLEQAMTAVQDSLRSLTLIE